MTLVRASDLADAGGCAPPFAPDTPFATEAGAPPRARRAVWFDWPRVCKQRIAPLNYARLLFGGRTADEARFTAQMKTRLGADCDVSFVARARVGLYLLTKYALRTGRRRVLMSPFTIPDVVNMVTLAGGEPVFYDFEPGTTSCDLKGLAALVDERTACVIVTHYHVNEPRLADIAALCAAHGAYLFKDCALALGGVIDGRPVGAIGDACVFSLSAFKLLNFLWGGMITTRDKEIAAFIARETRDWPRLRARDYVFPARLCLPYDLATQPLLFNLFVFPYFQRRARESGVAGGVENARIESRTLNYTLTARPALAAFAEWAGKLERAESHLAHRRRIAAIYLAKLAPYMVSPRAPRAGACFVNFPILVPGGARDAVRRTLMLAGFDLGANLYPNAHRLESFAACEGRSANVDALVRDTLYLPTHFGVSEAYGERLAAALAPMLEAAAPAPLAVAAE